MKLADLVADRRTITVPFGAHELAVSYAPSQWVYDLTLRYASMSVAELLTELRVEWDLEDDDGRIPCTEEGCKRVLTPVLRSIERALLKDAATLGEVEAPSPSG